MTPRDPATTTRAALEDLTAAVATIDHALRYINDTRSGYSTSTPGAALAGAQGTQECPRRDCLLTRPCPLHEADEQRDFGPVETEYGHVSVASDTPVERTAFTPDRAAAAFDMITLLANRIARDSEHLRQLCVRWGTSGIDATEVEAGLRSALNNMWCLNCAAHGFNQPKENGNYCWWCTDVKKTHKHYPGKQLLDWHHSGRRVYTSEIVASFKKVKIVTRVITPSPEEARARRLKRIIGAA